MAQGTPVKHKKKTKSVLKNIRQTERCAKAINSDESHLQNQAPPSAGCERCFSFGRCRRFFEKLASSTFSELDKARIQASAPFSENKHREPLQVTADAGPGTPSKPEEVPNLPNRATKVRLQDPGRLYFPPHTARTDRTGRTFASPSEVLLRSGADRPSSL